MYSPSPPVNRDHITSLFSSTSTLLGSFTEPSSFTLEVSLSASSARTALPAERTIAPVSNAHNNFFFIPKNLPDRILLFRSCHLIRFPVFFLKTAPLCTPCPSFWFLLTVCTRSVFRGSWILVYRFLLSFLIYPAEIVSNSFSVIIR